MSLEAQQHLLQEGKYRTERAQSSPNSHVLIRRLAATRELFDAEQEALFQSLESGPLYQRGTEITPAERVESGALIILISGLARTYAISSNGSRRILAFHVPGDILNLSSFLLKRPNHPVAAASRCEVAYLHADKVRALTDRFPNIHEALARQLGIEISILQKWMEPKKVLEAIAHLYCELYTRHLVVGLVRAGERLTLDLTQYELADAVGGSLVHTNKSARILKNQRLVKFSTGRSTVLNFEGLAKHSEFTTSYLGSLVTCEAQTKPIGTWQ